MKAIVVNQTGGPEVLEYTDAPDPTPNQGELLVDVDAAGVNFIDTYHRGGLYPIELPFTPGLEGAGVVVGLGEDVTEFAVGDRVGWAQTLGTYAERVSIPANRAVPIPMRVEPKIAAAVLLQGITAHYLAADTYPLGSDDTCLIHAGAGGVGLLLTQIAKLRDARVITTVGTQDKADLSRAAGADHVIVYTETDFVGAVSEIVGRNSVDVVYDGVGKVTFEPSLEVLRPRGMMVTFGNASGPVPEITPLVLLRKGSLFLTRPTISDYIETRAELLRRASELFGWIEEDKLDIRVGAEHPLQDASAAHLALEARATTGKVLLIP